jgi:hypothetical protein
LLLKSLTNLLPRTWLILTKTPPSIPAVLWVK